MLLFIGYRAFTKKARFENSLIFGTKWLPKTRKKERWKTSFTIQPETQELINKHISKNGKLVFGKYNTFGKYYSVISRKIAELAEVAWIDMRDNENNSSDSCEITKGLLSL